MCQFGSPTSVVDGKDFLCRGQWAGGGEKRAQEGRISQRHGPPPLSPDVDCASGASVVVMTSPGVRVVGDAVVTSTSGVRVITRGVTTGAGVGGVVA